MESDSYRSIRTKVYHRSHTWARPPAAGRRPPRQVPARPPHPAGERPRRPHRQPTGPRRRRRRHRGAPGRHGGGATVSAPGGSRRRHRRRRRRRLTRFRCHFSAAQGICQLYGARCPAARAEWAPGSRSVVRGPGSESPGDWVTRNNLKKISLSSCAGTLPGAVAPTDSKPDSERRCRTRATVTESKHSSSCQKIECQCI